MPAAAAAPPAWEPGQPRARLPPPSSGDLSPRSPEGEVVVRGEGSPRVGTDTSQPSFCGNSDRFYFNL